MVQKSIITCALGKSMETVNEKDTVEQILGSVNGKDAVEQILGSVKIIKCRNAGLWDSQLHIQEGKLAISVR